jgi:hypothetical protein
MIVRMSNSEGVATTMLGFGITVFVALKLGGYYAPTALCSSFLGMFLVLQLAYVLPANGVGLAVELLGQLSMPIYLTHVLATAGMRIFLMKLHVVSLPLHVVAGLIAGVVFPVFAYYLLYKLKWERWLGMSSGAAVFARPAPAPAPAAPTSADSKPAHD